VTKSSGSPRGNNYQCDTARRKADARAACPLQITESSQAASH
jgi:hypothetical protein